MEIIDPVLSWIYTSMSIFSGLNVKSTNTLPFSRFLWQKKNRPKLGQKVDKKMCIGLMWGRPIIEISLSQDRGRFPSASISLFKINTELTGATQITSSEIGYIICGISSEIRYIIHDISKHIYNCYVIGFFT